KEPMPELEIKKVVKIEEVIDSLTNRIQNALNLSFKEFSQGVKAENKEEAKVNVIISFLAMLELVREGIIEVVQNSSFEDIEISKTKAEALN
ncbi:MAG TPA: segregation/condensation protein A, partial [Candidatus Paceibacterota bacterium]|nr:segregation/condensation protein A [Candidatus Paceibacterota bacterium]